MGDGILPGFCAWGESVFCASFLCVVPLVPLCFWPWNYKVGIVLVITVKTRVLSDFSSSKYFLQTLPPLPPWKCSTFIRHYLAHYRVLHNFNSSNYSKTSQDLLVPETIETKNFLFFSKNLILFTKFVSQNVAAIKNNWITENVSFTKLEIVVMLSIRKNHEKINKIAEIFMRIRKKAEKKRKTFTRDTRPLRMKTK